MKKYNLLFCLMVIIGIITACGNQSTPESIANTYLKATPSFDYETMDSVSIVPYEILFNSVVASRAEQFEITEQEVYERLSKSYGFENEVHDFKEYKEEFIKYAKNDLSDEFGDDYSIDVSIINIEDMSNEDKSQMLSEASDYFDKAEIIISDIIDFSKIEQVKKVDAKIYYSGSKVEKPKTENMTIYLAQVNNDWKVLNIGAK